MAPNRFWQAALGVAGLASIAFFVFCSLYKDWLGLTIFPKLTQNQAFILMLFFLLLTFCALLAGVWGWLKARENYKPESVVHLVESLRSGLASPEQNYKAIEQIAQSGDPSKVDHLNALLAVPELSFIENDLIHECIRRIRAGQSPVGTFQIVQQKQLSEIKAQFPSEGMDAQVLMALVVLKYARNGLRKNNPKYHLLNAIIAKALSGRLTSEEILEAQSVLSAEK